MSKRFFMTEEEFDLVISNQEAKPDKVMPTLEQALEGVVIEWDNQ
jgi:hypothetical protein